MSRREFGLRKKSKTPIGGRVKHWRGRGGGGVRLEEGKGGEGNRGKECNTYGEKGVQYIQISKNDNTIH
jgi:hypothetical protein